MTQWTTIAQSPAVRAVRAALDRIDDLAGFDDPPDVRDFVRPATIPIANLRAALAAQGVPDGRFLGETFERRVYARRYEYFYHRNRESGVERFAADAQFAFYYELETAAGGTRFTRIEVCVSPSPLVAPTADYAAGVTRWLEWLAPHFAAGDVTVVFCAIAEPTLRLPVGAGAVLQRVVEAS